MWCFSEYIYSGRTKDNTVGLGVYFKILWVESRFGTCMEVDDEGVNY